MEITARHIRIRNYALSTIKYYEGQAEKLYIKKFNPFYKWKVGNIAEEEIRKAVVIFYNANDTIDKIKKNEGNAKAFSLLIDLYKEKLKSKKPETLTNNDWLTLRVNYEKQIKKEHEKTFGTIGFAENINYSKSQVNMPDVGSNTDEEEMAEVIKDEIMTILEQIYSSDNWLIKFLPVDTSNFHHHIVIINQQIPDKRERQVFGEALDILKVFFKRNYGANEFAVKAHKGHAYYLEGYFSIE